MCRCEALTINIKCKSLFIYVAAYSLVKLPSMMNLCNDIPREQYFQVLLASNVNLFSNMFMIKTKTSNEIILLFKYNEGFFSQIKIRRL